MKSVLLLCLVIILTSCSKEEVLPTEQNPSTHPFHAFSGKYSGSTTQTLTFPGQDSLGNWHIYNQVLNFNDFQLDVDATQFPNALNYDFEIPPNWLHLEKLESDSIVLDSSGLFDGNFSSGIGGRIIIKHNLDSIKVEFSGGSGATSCVLVLKGKHLP